MFKYPTVGAWDWFKIMLLSCILLSWMACCIWCWLLISLSVRAVGVFITINLLLGFCLLGLLHLWSNKGTYLIPPAFSCSVNCEHESRRLIKPHCPRLLSVLNFTPSINKAIIFLCTQSMGRLHVFSVLTIVYEGCFKDLLCISGSPMVNPLPKWPHYWCFHQETSAAFLFLQSSNCEGIVFWMHSWNGLSHRVLIHSFVGFNLQIVVASHMGIMQCKLLKRTQTEILKTEYVGGLIRAPAASFNTRGYFMLNGFMLLFSNLQWLSSVEPCLDPYQSNEE